MGLISVVFFNETATTQIYTYGHTLALHDALPIYLDRGRAPDQLEPVLARIQPHVLLSLGILDGRNVWRANLPELYWRLKPLAAERDLILAPSCSLLHVPVDVALETGLDPEVGHWLSFAVQKVRSAERRVG